MNTKQFSRGLRVGVPISLGYLAVSFTLGITAKNAGLSAFQATLTSLLVNASAGQYAAFTMMAAPRGLLGDRHFRGGDQCPGTSSCPAP